MATSTVRTTTQGSGQTDADLQNLLKVREGLLAEQQRSSPAGKRIVTNSSSSTSAKVTSNGSGNSGGSKGNCVQLQKPKPVREFLGLMREAIHVKMDQEQVQAQHEQQFKS